VRWRRWCGVGEVAEGGGGGLMAGGVVDWES
jgi:hypothetical protein